MAHSDTEPAGFKPTAQVYAAGTVEPPGSNVAAKAGLNRSILDAGWGQRIAFTSYKTVSAGRSVTTVRAAYTSQTCAECGHTDGASRVTRDHFACTSCGHADHADANAARVILALGEGRLKIRAPGRTNKTRPGAGNLLVAAGRDTP